MGKVWQALTANTTVTVPVSPGRSTGNVLSGYVSRWNGDDLPVWEYIDLQASSNSMTGVSWVWNTANKTLTASAPRPFLDEKTGQLCRIRWDKSWEVREYAGFVSANNQVTMLEYDSEWSNGATINKLLTCNFQTPGTLNQAAYIMDRFNHLDNWQNFGTVSVLEVLLDKELGEFEMSSTRTLVCCKLVGMDKGELANTRIIQGICTGPTLWMGNSAIIPDTANTVYLYLGTDGVVQDVVVTSHTTTQHPVRPKSFTWQWNTRFTGKVKCYSTPATSSGTMFLNRQTTCGPLIFERASAFKAGPVHRDVRARNSREGVIFDLGTGSDDMNCTMFSMENLISEATDRAVTFEMSAVKGTVTLGNIIAVHTHKYYPNNFYGTTQPAFSLSGVTQGNKIYINTAIFKDYETLAAFTDNTLNNSPRLIHIDKLAVQNVSDLSPDIIKYRQLFVIPDGEQIFADEEAGNFDVVHPVLVSNMIGIDLTSRDPYDSILHKGIHL